MGPSELSGVSGNGFRQDDAGSDRRSVSPEPSAAASGIPKSGTSSAITGVLVLFILFAGFDLYRTLDVAKQRLGLHADIAASQLSDLPVEAITGVAADLVAAEAAHDIRILHEDGSVLTSTAPAPAAETGIVPGDLLTLSVTTDVPGPAGALVVSTGTIGTLTPFWWHLVIAGALSAAVIGLTTWRASRQQTPLPDREVDSLIGSTPFGIALWDASGQLRTANRAFRRRLALKTSTTETGTGYKQLRKMLLERGRLNTLRDDETGRCTEYFMDEGSCLTLDEYPLPTGGFITLVEDCTEQRHVEERLAGVREEHRQMEAQLHREVARAEEASRAKSAFLAHLSHEIRTPLNHIIGFSDLICHQSYGPIGDERYANYVDHIRESGELLLASFNEILEFAELESGEKLLRRDDVAVKQLLDDILKRHSASAAELGVTLSISQSSGAVIRGDAHCLGRMISNIVENAVRYTPKGGRVSLAAWEADDGVVLEISDTGVGISSERLRSLGQAFVLGDDVFRRDREGAGLGIAISRTIAELSGGSMIIDSTPGMGTTVAIALPLDAARQAAKEQAA